MKQFFTLMCIVFFTHTSFAQANNFNGDNIDIKFVRFNMFVDPALAATDVNMLKGSVTTYFTTKLTNVQTIKFDFYHDDAATPLRNIGDSIRYHGVKYNLSAANHPTDTLVVTLPSTIPAIGTLDSVTVYFHGNTTQSASSRGYKKTAISTVNIISTHSSGFFARQWWPCKHNMTDKIDSVEFLITAPSAYIAVANGLLKNGPTPPTDGSGNKTWHWKSNYLVAHYLIAMAVHPYVVYNSPSAIVSGTTVPIINYLTAGTNTATIKGNCDAMKGVIEHFSTLFGDYPFKNEKYGHVAYTFGGGMENQTASYIGTGAFTRSIMAHELAHQWWGDKVTCSKWNNIWVNESFARYAEILYSEQFETAALAVTKRGTYKNSTAQSGTNTVYRYDVEVVTEADHTGKIFNSAMVYDKGSIIISMLRKLVGETNFFQALKNYLNDPLISYGYSTTEDVRRHFEAVSGRDLTAFFDDFIYSAGYPTYNVQWAYSATAKKVGIQLNQTKTSSGTNAVAGRFHTVLPIRLRKTTAPVKDTLIVVYDDGVASLGTLPFNVSFDVDAIEVDPDFESYAYNNTVTLNSAIAVTLPVTLIKFNGYKKNNDVNILWESNIGSNFSHYEIEHSSDGANFYKIGVVTATNQSANNYEFIHRQPSYNKNYYRLKMIDVNGQAKYSNVIVVVMGQDGKVKIIPNPVVDKVQITLPEGFVNNTPVKLVNLQGQVIQLIAVKTNSSTIELNVSNIASGNYWLEMQVNGTKVVERILIQH
jgi:Peptidase family M1 domain/Secretion system C-terminal sorting domain